MDKWPHQNKVDEFYGNPRGANGRESAAWVRQNIVALRCPWKLVTSWDQQPVRAISIHQKCAESLGKVLSQIWANAGQDQAKINEWGMNLYGGGFNFRLMRGSNRLSMHSWGCAIDFDPSRNGLGDVTPNFEHIPEVLTAFAAEGWVWGGRWRRPDGMHWQAATV